MFLSRNYRLIVSPQKFDVNYDTVKRQAGAKVSRFEVSTVDIVYTCLYNNQINARALIGQSAMGCCAGKPVENSLQILLVFHQHLA